MSEDIEEQLQRSLANRGHADHGGTPIKGLLYPELSRQIVGACIEVHRHLGPRQLESVYQKAVALELRRCGIAFRSQVPLSMTQGRARR